MVAQLTRRTHKIAIQVHLMSESRREPYHLQFLLQVASPVTFGYNLV
jgi:ribosomal silencing factor RsfS